MDPCLYFSLINNALVVFVAWIDDVMVLSPPLMVEQVQRDLKMHSHTNAKGNSLNTLEASLILHKAKIAWDASGLLSPF